MKKVLISIITLLLLIISCFTVVKGISFLHIKSIKGIKTASNKLNSKFDEAEELSNRTYPNEIEKLEKAIKDLKIVKKEFDSKNIGKKEKASLGTVEVKTYKIHYLWTILGNYRKERGVKSLNLDLRETQVEDVYNLDFTLVGNYVSITDFIYDIENDEELSFEVKGFTVAAAIDDSTETQNDQNAQNNNNALKNNTNSSTETTQKQEDGINLQAKFTVEDIGITLD